MMVSSSISKAFNLIGLGHFAFALYYHFTVISPIDVKFRGFEFGGPFIYITILASVVRVIYYVVALAYDFSSSNSIRQFRDFLFATLALPLAFETSLMFWIMVNIDRELVFPKAVDEFFPWWLNLMLHTNVSIFIILDILVCRHQYPRRKSAIRGLILFLLSYLILIYAGKLTTGIWVYGIIEVLTAPQRIAFFVISGLVTLGLYFIGEMLNKHFAGKKTDVKVKGK